MDSGQHADRQSPGILRTFLSLLVMVAFVFGLSWVLRTYVFQAYEIPSGLSLIHIYVALVAREKGVEEPDPQKGQGDQRDDPERPVAALLAPRGAFS